jgi:hypothetical protein
MDPMSPGKFAQLLDRHGPRPECWPPRLRASAAALLARSEEARAALRAAEALDATLRRGLPEPAPEAVARLRESVARRIARTPLPTPPSFRARLMAQLRPAAPAGWGALAALAASVLWLALAPPAGMAEVPLGPLLTLPVAGDTL